MPYAGHFLSLDEMLCYTGNGWGIIGLLAYELNFTDHLKENEINDYINWNSDPPLKQSVVLALTILEHYFNPGYI